MCFGNSIITMLLLQNLKHTIYDCNSCRVLAPVIITQHLFFVIIYVFLFLVLKIYLHKIHKYLQEIHLAFFGSTDIVR